MTRQQRLVLAIAVLASTVVFLDGSVINVALPQMSSELGGGLSTQQWILDAYLITLGSLILLAGSLSDLFGRILILPWLLRRARRSSTYNERLATGYQILATK